MTLDARIQRAELDLQSECSRGSIERVTLSKASGTRQICCGCVCSCVLRAHLFCATCDCCCSCVTPSLKRVNAFSSTARDDEGGEEEEAVAAALIARQESGVTEGESLSRGLQHSTARAGHSENLSRERGTAEWQRASGAGRGRSEACREEREGGRRLGWVTCRTEVRSRLPGCQLECLRRARCR